MLKAPGMLIKDALTVNSINKKAVVKEGDSDKQFSPEFEALLKEYESKGAISSR